MKYRLLAVGEVMFETGMTDIRAETPRIDQRQVDQDQRIDRGVASGQVNEWEAIRMNRQQGHMNKMEDRTKFEAS